MLDEKLKKNLADNLIRLRTSQGYTQEELVMELKKKDVDISRTALASYENQRSFPRLDVLYIISRFFNTDIESLLEEKDNSGNLWGKKLVNKLDLTTLFQDCSDAMMYIKLYRGAYFSLAKQLIQTSEQKEEVFEMINGVYDNERRDLNQFKNMLKEHLNGREILIFQGINNGMSVQELSEQFHTNIETITSMFIQVQRKIFDLLLADSTEKS